MPEAPWFSLSEQVLCSRYPLVAPDYDVVVEWPSGMTFRRDAAEVYDHFPTLEDYAVACLVTFSQLEVRS